MFKSLSFPRHKLAAALTAALLSGALLMGTAPGPAVAAGDGGLNTNTSSLAGDPTYVQAVALIKAEQYGQAIPLLQQVVQTNPTEADPFNWLGFAMRQTGQNDDAFTYYYRALELDPKHTGAMAYLGELYLKVGDLAKAQELEQRLVGACPFGCSQLNELRASIASYMESQGSS
ncbi:MAG: tetratricopeptide repeat protein [Alphaproteobacteria bacterium]